MLWPFLSVIIAFLKPETFTFLPLVNFVLFCLLIILIFVTLTLKIFSILFLRFFLLALLRTLKTILFSPDKLVDFSVSKGDKILSYRWSFSILGNYDDFVIAYQDGANASTYDTLCDLNAGQNGTFNGRKTAGGNADGNGYGNFSMAVPTGYYSLCSKNIAEFG